MHKPSEIQIIDFEREVRERIWPKDRAIEVPSRVAAGNRGHRTLCTLLARLVAFLAVVLLVMIGLTDAARSQEQNPGGTKRLAVTQDLRSPQSEARNAQRGSAESAPTTVPTLEEKIARICETANWRFVTKRFIETIEQRQGELHGVAVNMLGIVRDQQDEPVIGAFVLLRLKSPSRYIRPMDGIGKVAFAVAWTDDKGVFVFHNQPTPWFEPARPIDWELCVFAPGHAVESRRYQNLDGQNRKEVIDLQPERVIEAIIKDADGEPISELEFAHAEIVNPYHNTDLEYSVFRSELQVFIQPDKQGRIRIGGLPPQRIANIIPRHGRKIGGQYAIHIATSADMEPENMIAKDRPRSGLVYPYLEPTCEIVIERMADNPARNAGSRKAAVKQLPMRTVTVRVINAENGGGVSGVTVGLETGVEELWIEPGMHVTDKEGTAKLEIPQRAVDVFIGGRRFGFVTPYQRITTDPEEYTPTVQRDYSVRRIDQGEQDLSVTFELQPVPPLQITVQKEDGTPVIAKLQVLPHGWLQPYRMQEFYSDERGQASVAIRPVWFEVDITATTKDGLKGSLTTALSKDFTRSDSVNVIVK